MNTYVPSWPPKPDPVFCSLCEQVKMVWSYVVERDLKGLHEIDVELICGHRVLTTTRKRGSDGTA